MLAKIEFAAAKGATTVLLQGGHNPALPLDYYLTLVRESRRRFPAVTPHFFTASEIQTMAEVSGLTIPDVLARLTEAGQDTLPGGGAEVLSERVRKRIEPKKGGPERVARRAPGGAPPGLPVHRHHDVRPRRGRRTTSSTTGTRSASSRTSTAASPPSCRGRSSPATRCSRSGSSTYKGPSTYLRMLAASRLYLDNFAHIQASWFSEGKRAGQVALHWGADDFGGTLFEENVHAAADYVNKTTVDEIITLIRDAGFTPVQRTTEYELLKSY